MGINLLSKEKSMLVALRGLMSITSIIIAGVLLYEDKTGWGWFVFTAIICSPVKLTEEEEEL